MPWWGGGSDSSSSSSSNHEADFTSHEEVSMSPGMSSGGGGGGGMAEMQQMGMVLQQQMLVQQVINDLTDRAYEKCITSKPSDSLTGSQVACIKATVNKWMDTNEFMSGRLNKKAQQNQGMH